MSPINPYQLLSIKLINSIISSPCGKATTLACIRKGHKIQCPKHDKYHAPDTSCVLCKNEALREEKTAREAREAARIAATKKEETKKENGKWEKSRK